MSFFYERLRDARKKLGLSQEEFGVIAGVKKRAQQNYEKGDRKPDSDYLAEIAKHGVDIGFLITGIESNPIPSTLPADEQLLVDSYRALPMPKRRELLASLLKGEPLEEKGTSTRTSNIKQNDNNGMQITGDNNTQVGSIKN